METKKLSLEEMKMVEGGGCSISATRAVAVIGMAAGIGSAFGGIGAIIAAPTALGMGIASLYCAFS